MSNTLHDYNYLKKIYILESFYVLFVTVAVVLMSYAFTARAEYVVLGVAAVIPLIIEILYLRSVGKIKTHNKLVIPRIFHFASVYVLMLSISVVLPGVIFEYLILVPIGLSLLGLHPFFNLKSKIVSTIIIMGTGFSMVAVEISSERYLSPILLENYILIVFISLLVAFYVYLSSRLNIKSRELLALTNKKLESQLASTNQANQRVENLTYKLTRDFRNVIASIDSNFEKLGESSDKKDVKELALEGQLQSRNLAEFIDSFTEHQQLTASVIDPETIDLNRLISDQLSALSEQRNFSEIDVKLEPYVGDIFQLDKISLETIIRNLLKNAVDFSKINEAQAYIKVKSFSEGENLIILVEDNGIGIPQEKQHLIYDMFYTSKSGGSSNGLGLYEVREALNKIGGDINVKSEEGKGSAFEVNIPFIAVG